MRKLVTERRVQLGWSKSDLARALGSSPSRVAKLEAGDPSVSRSLYMRALEAMGCVLKAEPAEGALEEGQRRAFGRRLLRRRRAEVISRKTGLDVGDLEQALLQLELSPAERLERSLRRARLGRLSTHAR